MPDYRQCTTIGTFHSNTTELLYFLFVMTMSLILPLVIMIGSYLTIVWVICRFFIFLFRTNLFPILEGAKKSTKTTWAPTALL